jgi:hypothetical protein
MDFSSSRLSNKKPVVKPDFAVFPQPVGADGAA